MNSDSIPIWFLKTIKKNTANNTIVSHTNATLSVVMHFDYQ